MQQRNRLVLMDCKKNYKRLKPKSNLLKKRNQNLRNKATSMVNIVALEAVNAHRWTNMHIKADKRD